MNDDAASTSTALVVENAQSSAQALPTAASASRSLIRLWHVLIFIVLVLLIVATLTLWQRLDWLQTEAARRLSTAEQTYGVVRASNEALSNSLRSAEARLAAAEARIADYTAQRASLDKLLADATSRESLRISGDFEQLLTIAEQEAQLTLNAGPLLTALRVLDARADLAPANARDKLKIAINKDTEALRATDLPDRTQLLSKSDELSRLLDEVPLAAEVKEIKPAAGAKNNTKTARDNPVVVADTPATTASSPIFNVRNSINTLPSIGEFITTLAAPLTEWFKIRRIDSPQAVLTSPEQLFWLRENMKLQAQSARLSLLARQSDSFQRNLEKVQQGLAQYADGKQAKVQQAQALVTQLRAARLNAVLPTARETRTVLLQLANTPIAPVLTTQVTSPSPSAAASKPVVKKK
jgi:uroporphyrin-III C-methyltransferase